MDLRRTIITALCAALIVVGSYVAIPVGPVPITLQTLFVLLAGVLAGQKVALGAVATYLALGSIGLPVFFGGIGGVAHFAGPTGGFLISWLVAGPVAGYFTDKGFKKSEKKQTTTKTQLLWIILGSTVGTLSMFVIGIPYLKLVLEIPWAQALSIGFFPFIPGDGMKLVATVVLGNIFAPLVRTFITDGLTVREDHE
ncbi:MAG: biotin transporter BioY [Sphaerochaetaceae bacterium]|jgi:biotin transport system substrate-specific component